MFYQTGKLHKQTINDFEAIFSPPQLYVCLSLFEQHVLLRIHPRMCWIRFLRGESPYEPFELILWTEAKLNVRTVWIRQCDNEISPEGTVPEIFPRGVVPWIVRT